MCEMKKYETNSNLSGWSKFTMNKKLIFSLALTFLLTSIATATTRNVSSGGPYTTIQAAITAAVSGVDDVNVADGNYTGTGNRNLDFGGKAITVHSANGPANCIINCGGTSGNRAFYFHNGETSASVVRGFTIINGNTDYGGAIECYGYYLQASPTIDNCIIKNNTAIFGGVIDCFVASPVITNCIITNNSSAYDGGAIECESDSAPKITNCLFANNTAGGNGTIDCYDFSSPVIKNCTIANNTGSSNFGGIYTTSSTATIRNSILWNNGDDIYGATATYSCIQDGDTGTGNISTDPMFRIGPSGNYYLSQTAAGQLANSPCVNGGGDAVTAIYNPSTSFTTRTDYVPDAGQVDMGFHYSSSGATVQYKLITQVNAGGGGTVDPNYPAPGQNYLQYSEVSLHATPISGCKFMKWQDANTATPGTFRVTPGPNEVYVVALNADRTVTANFSTLATYKLITYVHDGNGTILNVDPNNYPDPLDTRAHFIPQDTNAIITVKPNTGYVVKQWLTGNTATFDINNPATYTVIPGSVNSYTAHIGADTTVAVEFKSKQYVLTTYVDISYFPDSGGIIHGTISPKRGLYPVGTTVELVANPDNGYKVKAWGGDLATANKPKPNVNTNSVVMDANKIVTVQFNSSATRLIVVRSGDANGIQNAIDQATDGDIVQIPPGTYVATGFKVVNKSITILGDPQNPENVVIDGTNENVSFREPLGFQFSGSGNCVLNGVTIANILIHHGVVRDNKSPDQSKASYGPDMGQAIYIDGGNHQILNCIIRNVVVIGGNGGNGSDGNTIVHRGGDGGDGGSIVGGGIVVFGGSPAFKNCIIEDCCAIGGNGANGANGYVYSSDTDPNNGDAGQGGLAGFAFGGGISIVNVDTLPSYTYIFYIGKTRFSIPVTPRDWYGVYPSTLPSPTFENCTISNCHAKGGHGGNGGNAGISWGDPCGYGGLTTVAKAGQGDIINNNSARGGGVFIGQSCNAKFINCTIADSATEGSVSGLGGLSYWKVQQQPKKNYHLPTFGAGVFCDRLSTVNFSNCNLQSNYTISTNAGETIPSDDNDFSGGAGLALWYARSAEVNDCNFTLNSAPIGGGIYGFWTSLKVIDSNIASNNSYSGGGIYALNSIVGIKQSLIKGNNAGTQSDLIVNTGYPLFGSGGGVYALASVLDINDTTITENFAKTSGGGICIDGWFTPEPHRPSIKNCLITGNTAVESGGGITSTIFADPQILNCTIANNTVSDVNSNGGGLYGSLGSDTLVKDTIFWNNSGVDGSQIALSDGGLYTDMPASITITYSDIDLRIRSGADLSASDSGGSSGSGATLVNQQTIYDKINSSGSANVIVSLVEPGEAQTTDWSSTASVSDLQGKIATQQAQVLSTLNTSEFTLQHRLSNVAVFSGSVTVAGLNKLLSNPLVAHVEADKEMCPKLAQGIPLMNALNTRSTFNGQGVSIAICDTGIDYTHPKLGGGGFPNSKVIGGYDFGDMDTNPMPGGTTTNTAHGTCCAGIAAGMLGTVGDYIGGVAYGAKLYALKISSNSSDSSTYSAMAAAWDWCISHMNDNPSYPIKIISTSFGGGKYSTAAAAEADNPALATVAKRAVAAGITILASAGNDGYTDSLETPAAFSSVISVGAVYDAVVGTEAFSICTDSQTAPDKVTCYSDTAGILSILAPSNDAYTTDIAGSSGYSSGDYAAQFGGTSAACPYAAGGVAALQSAAKQIRGAYLTPAQVKNLLITSGTPVTDTKVAITKPRINLGAAIVMLTPSIPVYTERSCTITGLQKDVNDNWTVASSSNISQDPNFILGYYLSHIATEQNIDSVCIDAGSTTSTALKLNTYTTRLDGVVDTGIVDMGFHYTSTMPQYDITIKILPDANYPGINGTITCDTNNLISYNPATATYTYRFYGGMTPTFTVVPNTNFFIKGWYDKTDTMISSQNSITITVNSDNTYSVRLRSKSTIPVSGGGDALITAVNNAENGDTLVVAAGTYHGGINFAGKQIQLYGVNPDDSNITQKVIIDCSGGTSGFRFSGGENSDTVINGFTIINGNANSSPGSAIFIDSDSSPTIANIEIRDFNVVNVDGAAIYIGPDSGPNFTKVHISNCKTTYADGGAIFINTGADPVFTDCSVTNCRAYSGSGGAAYCADTSKPTFNNCTFTGNSADTTAGAIFCNTSCESRFEGCSFANNTVLSGSGSRGNGGGIFYALKNTFEVNDCNFSGNGANSGAAVFASGNCSGTLNNTQFSKNAADNDGGAVYITDSNVIHIEDCSITDNNAIRGGGIFAVNSSKAAIVDCQINFNGYNPHSSSGLAGQGGGIYSFNGPALIESSQINNNASLTSGGGIYVAGGFAPNIHNCLITNNITNRDGGGVSANWNVQLTLSNCTIADNNVADDISYGGGLSCAYDANTTVINSILWNDSAVYGPEISIGSNFDAAMKQKAKVSVSYSDVEGGSADAFVDTANGCILNWNAGNLSGASATNPLFVSGYMGNFYLSQITTGAPFDSPCVDKGLGTPYSNNLYKHTTRTDRVIDTGVVDMGYHYTLIADPLGDFNFDSYVSFDDLALFMLYWLDDNCTFPYWCFDRDLNHDGIVNFTDYAIFAENFGRFEMTPPIPNPMTWANIPSSSGTTQITMRASTAIDAFSGPTVQYYFKCVSGGGHDSNWVSDPLYTDTGLTTGVKYGYEVKARDTHHNETGYSVIGYAIAGDDTTPPTPNPMTWATPPYATSTSSIRMVATTATDTSGVEYYFDCNSPAPSHNSGWVTRPDYNDTGLLPNTLYRYRVKARDKSSHHNETGYSVLADANTGQIVTPPPTDVNAPTPNPSQWAAGGTPHYVTSDGITFTLTMTAATATDTQSPPVWYYFDCVNAGSSYDSGWTLNPTWTKDFIAQGYLVYRVYTKDSASPPNYSGYSPKYGTDGYPVP
jgi:hypothetical protein